MIMTLAFWIITTLALGAMIAGGAFLVSQHFPYWKQHGGKENILGIIAGAVATLLAIWTIVTQFLLPSTLDSHTVELLALSRRVLFVAAWLFFIAIGLWEFVWKK